MGVQGPGVPGPPVKNRAGLAKSRPCAFSARHSPHLGEGKETGRPQARPKLGPTTHDCLTIEYVSTLSVRPRPWVPAFAGTNAGEDRWNIRRSALLPLSSLRRR